MVCGRRRLCPFQGRRALTPVVVSHMLLRGERAENNIQEHQERDAADIGADRGHEVPTREGSGVVRIAARHARQAKEMLREEDQIDAYEREPKMHLTPEFWILVAGHLSDPVVEAAEDGEHRT